MDRKDIENLRNCFNGYKGDPEYFNKLHSAIQNIESSFELDEADKRIEMPKQYRVTVKDCIAHLQNIGVAGKPKRYNLVIPGNLEAWESDFAATLDRGEVEILNIQNEYAIIKNISTGSEQLCLKKWIIEIELDPAKEAYKNAYITTKESPPEYENYFTHGFHYGEKHNKLKHEEIETFDEWFDKNNHSFVEQGREAARPVWKSALKSRGYND